MDKIAKKYVESLKIDRLHGYIRHEFKQFSDTRDDNWSISMEDALMSGYALFSLKDSSLNKFNKERSNRKKNLKSVYKINNAPCGQSMRTILDPIAPELFNPIFEGLLNRIKKAGILKKYECLNGYIACSIDGVHYFSSECIHCKRCIQYNKTNGKKEYRHYTLSSVIMHPEKSVIFPIAHEEIVRQDGKEKNDCEANAAKRLIPRIKHLMGEQKVVIVEDALSANGPHIRVLRAANFRFIISIKPEGNKNIFKQFNKSKAYNRVKFLQIERDSFIHHFYWANNMPLNDTHPDIRVNVLDYYQFDPRGKEPDRHFTWITDFELRARNVYKIMRVGRSRWKIENETFNTLKNQGYNFSHNYGHGHQFLSTVFMLLMMLAFFIDQIQQGYNELFQKAWKKVETKKSLWQKIRQKFEEFEVDSMELIYKLIIGLVKVRTAFYEDSG